MIKKNYFKKFDKDVFYNIEINKYPKVLLKLALVTRCRMR